MSWHGYFLVVTPNTTPLDHRQKARGAFNSLGNGQNGNKPHEMTCIRASVDSYSLLIRASIPGGEPTQGQIRSYVINNTDISPTDVDTMTDSFVVFADAAECREYIKNNWDDWNLPEEE